MNEVQASEIDFALHTLGWKSFQDLCLTISAEILGQTVQRFLSSNDGGRDGAFQGKWNNALGNGVDGTFTIQCKHSILPHQKLTLADVKDEVEKAHKLGAQGLADNYLLITNAPYSGSEDSKIKREFSKIPGIKSVTVLGKTWINQTIRESPRLRMLVPRVYGLGDLSQIIDSRAYDHAKEVLDSLSDDLAKFVITEAHKKSAKALNEYGFVLILGEAASGKSTIAATLSLGAIDQWALNVIKVTSPSEFSRHWNPHERQLFWVDDAFGATQYQLSSTQEWNKLLSHMNAALQKSTKFIFTSRDCIFNAARSDLKASSFPLFNDSQVIINVQNLTKDEKSQILYNHIKLGNQDLPFKKSIKPFLDEIANSPRFLPEAARRLGNKLFTKKVRLSKGDLLRFIEFPLDLLMDVINNLDDDSRATLAFVFMNNGKVKSPVNFDENGVLALELLGADKNSVISSLPNLKESLLKQVYENGDSFWMFKHPTISDAMSKIVMSNPEYLKIYLLGTPIDKVINEVVCGDVPLEGSPVRVASVYFQDIIEKMKSLKNKSLIYNFLSYRCGKEFIEMFLGQWPGFLSQLEIYSSFSICPSLKMVVRLKKLGLLPENDRIEIIRRMGNLAVNSPDLDFLEGDLRLLFHGGEIRQLMGKIRGELIPNLKGTIDRWADDCDIDEDPGDYFGSLSSILERLKDEFTDPETQALLDVGLDYVSDEISRLQDKYHDPYRSRFEDEGVDYSRSSGSSGRSIFDDVDD